MATVRTMANGTVGTTAEATTAEAAVETMLGLPPLEMGPTVKGKGGEAPQEYDAGAEDWLGGQNVAAPSEGRHEPGSGGGGDAHFDEDIDEYVTPFCSVNNAVCGGCACACACSCSGIVPSLDLHLHCQNADSSPLIFTHIYLVPRTSCPLPPP